MTWQLLRIHILYGGNTMLCEKMKHNLDTCILPFWESMIDKEYGGYYGLLDYDLTLDKQADKGCILNSRILWFFSNVYLETGDESVLPYAKQAYDFFKEFCYDQNHGDAEYGGGIYWSVTYDGKPADTIKHTYNQAFAIYALSSYYDATKDTEALDYAYKIFHVIENLCRLGSGYGESYTIDFIPNVNDKLSENNIIADKTMNTLLHICEAYTELYRVDHNEEVKERLTWTVREFLDNVYRPELHRLEVFFDKDMNSLIDLHSYGHDIEASWLVNRALEVLDDPDLTASIRPMLLDLADRIYQRAYVNHSVMAECENGVDLTTRIWWVQCEAIIGFYNAYQLTGEERYKSAAEDVWEYTEKYIVDSRPNSEWFYEVDAEGRPNTAKPILEQWKCPYHNGRACLEIMRRMQG